jgi:hypothetical protein
MRTENPKQQPKPSTDSLKKGDTELSEEGHRGQPEHPVNWEGNRNGD